MSNIIQNFQSSQLEKLKALRPNSNDFNLTFKVGDSVRVKYKIREGANTRLQAFSGIVISKTKSFSHYSATFTVRKMSDNIGVERKFTINSPLVDSIELLKKGIVRRAKLYYIRNLTGKAARIREKLDFVSDSSSEG